MQGTGSPMPEKSVLPWIIGVIVVVIAVVGLYFVTRDGGKSGEEAMMKPSEDAAMMDEEDKMMKDESGDAMMKTEEELMMEDKGGAMMEGAGTYETYDPSKLAMAKDGKVVLFFRASWCPTCRALDADVRKNLSGIPSGVTILDVNYDTEKDLKTKYGITTQHTLVQVDVDGKELGKWVGSSTLADLVSKIK